MEKAIHFEILGPIRVWAEGGEVTVTGRERSLLAMLLLHADQPVETARLIDAIWDEAPPRDGRGQLQGCVSRLRKHLASAGIHGHTIRTDPAGYRIDVDNDAVDLQRFHQQLAEARRAAEEGRHRDARDSYRAALTLWRGPALAGIDSSMVRTAATALDEERVRAAEERIEVDLMLGAAGELVPELTDLVARHPYRESLHGALMVALHRAGRQADALAAYQRVRELLIEEVGTEPGAKLRELHQAILRNELTVAEPVAGSEPAPPAIDRVVTPRQLPADVVGFTGRTAYLEQLDELLAAGGATAVVVTAIDGMAGIGKTALAVHAAHRITDRYRDGQLFIDLHGYTQGMAPVDPGEALDRMLRSLGVPGEQIPQDLDERAGLYRSRLADRQMLILLDNAATEAQVGPLLPGSPGCLVLVTSRRRLSGLDPTQVVSLDTLPLPDALTLFTRTAGAQRLTSQPAELLAETMQLCGRLPLAIRIAAARLRAHPTWGMSHLVERLREQRNRLAELEAGQRSVAAALELSYQQLAQEQRHAYRLLGLHPGPDLDASAVAALTGTTLPAARRLLDQLLDAHLLQEPTPGRYRFHDLVRAHATQTAATDGAVPEHRTALARLFDHYVYTARAAASILYPHEAEQQSRINAGPTPSNPNQATAWLDTDLPNLLAVAQHATDHGWPEHVIGLSNALRRHLRTRGSYADAEVLHTHALASDRSVVFCSVELDALIGLGDIHRSLSRHVHAIANFERALDLARATGHRTGELNALLSLGYVHLPQGRHAQAADDFGKALDIARSTGHRNGWLGALRGLADAHRRQGRYEHAAGLYRQILELAQEIGSRNWQFEAVQGLGRLHHTTGHSSMALADHQQALEFATDLEQPNDQARAHDGLAHAHHSLNQHRQARRHWQTALDILTNLGIDHTDDQEANAAAIRAHLAEIGHEQ